MFNWVLNKPACALTLAVVRRKNNIQYQVYVDIWKVLSVPLTKKTVTRICSIKKVFLKFRKIHNLCQSLFFKKVAGFSNYLFYGESFKNTFFYRTALVDASYQVTWAPATSSWFCFCVNYHDFWRHISDSLIDFSKKIWSKVKWKCHFHKEYWLKYISIKF